MERVFRKDAQDEEKAVSAVGNDRIRKDGMRSRPLAMGTDQPADPKAYLLGLSIKELDKSTAIISMNTQ